jgi:two-component system nitrate/nitrite response regulator NarP
VTRILIADDHRIIVTGLEAILRDSPFEVAGTVEDGSQVVEAVRTLRPDILILDVSMPRMNGIEALAALRGDGQRLPVAMLTAELQDSELVEAVRLGVDGIVLKEAAHSQLLPCLEALRDGGRWLDEAMLERVRSLDAGAGQAGDPLHGLNARERAIAKLIARGMRNRDIAGQLDMNEGTVKVYLYRIYKKLGLGSRTELAIRLRDTGNA